MTTENKVQHDVGEDLNYSSIWEIGITFALLSLIATIYLYGLYLRVDHAEKDRKLVQTVNTGIETKIQNQKIQIDTVGWADREQNLARVPVSVALSSTVAQLNLDRKNLPVTGPASVAGPAGGATAGGEKAEAANNDDSPAGLDPDTEHGEGAGG